MPESLKEVIDPVRKDLVDILETKYGLLTELVKRHVISDWHAEAVKVMLSLLLLLLLLLLIIFSFLFNQSIF